MGAFISQLLQAGANTAQNIVGTGLGLLLEKHNDKRQIRQQQRLQEMQMQGQKEMTDYNYRKQMQMWKDTNYSAQMEELKKAGLNPGLLYGMGGGGGTTAAVNSGQVSGGQAPSGGGEVVNMVGQQLQYALLDAQRKNIEADTRNKEVEATKKAGVDTDNVKADTQNKILQQVVTDYTGREAKDFYEKVKRPNRDIESKTWMDELAARQGIAGTIYELWVEGKLHDKSVAEVEKILLDNAKTREETRKIYKEMELLEENIKGAKLGNIITELESKLQTQTGIDRNSPTWMKILGRLFVELFNK